ncbi:MAG: proteasome accessory factor [Frankiales bacterium]|jgi:proteasome accessory factor B|nr:proteasome accessory factor [Frankiales bacterium]
MSARRTERLLNLVICLLSTRRYLSAQQIREMVPGYGPSDDDAFRRMFERDKEELRDLGIPLEVGSDTVWEDEPGYRIAARDYELPEIALTADEAAAVGLAARLWAQAGLAEAASSAMIKLRAAGIEADTTGLAELEPHVDATEPAFEPLLDALHARKAVRFDYRAGPAAPTATRTLDAWGVVSWHGRWYVVGHDRDRDAARVFRLSRIVGPVRPAGALRTGLPDGVDLRSFIERVYRREPSTEATARVSVRPGAAHQLRRWAAKVDEAADEERGWDVVTILYGDLQWLAQGVAGHADDVVALDPPELVAAVVRRLRAAAS